MRAAQGRLERSQRQLADAERAGQRVAAEPLDDVPLAEEEPGLRAAEQLVAARDDEVGSGLQRGCGVWLVGEEWVGAQQSGTDVDHDRDTKPGEGAGRNGGGEAGDDEVRRVHLEHETGRVTDRGAVVVEGRAVRRT